MTEPAKVPTREGAGETREQPRLGLPLFLFGVGLGAFVDGIVLHQVLQWHHMISDTDEGSMTTVAGLEANTLADGLFHILAFVVVLAGLYLLVRARQSQAAAPPPLTEVTGWLLVGWATFNLVEGVVDHHLLTVHHVRDDVSDPLPWDVGFLAVSAALLVLGLWLLRHAAGRAATGRVEGPGRSSTRRRRRRASLAARP